MSQGIQVTLETRKGKDEYSPQEPPERMQPADTLILGLLIARTVENTFVLLSH